jgi:hypothetical protein
MMDYCARDVLANKKVLDHMLTKQWPLAAHHTESIMTYYLTKQEHYGVGFNEEAAIKLTADLTQQRADLTRSLQRTFPPIEVNDGPAKRWKRDMVCRKYDEGDERWFAPRVKGEVYQKTKIEEFNPGSTQHIAKRLTDRYDWEPQDFTPGGQAQITDDILRDLPWAEAKQCADFQGLKKALGYVSEGEKAWLRFAKNGRIHGRVKATGAVTNRASHSNPNLANVPKVDKAYGKECRALFVAGGGDVPMSYKLVGCDASSLQLSIYAHFVGRYDDGELAALCSDKDGDPHEYMRKISGLHLRESQKTLTYATWFGAQNYKQGTIVIDDWTKAYALGIVDEAPPSIRHAAQLGKAVDVRMRTSMKGFKEMNRACEKAARRGHILGLDGRKIPVSQERLALLTLLQGNEAIVMKRAYVLAMEALSTSIDLGMCHPVLWVHDEVQFAVEPSHAELVGTTMAECITQAGVDLGLRLRLGADYKVGNTWAETH